MWNRRCVCSVGSKREREVRRNRKRRKRGPVRSGMRRYYGQADKKKNRKVSVNSGLRRLRAWASGALCTYREMNQVAGSKAGRCLLLTRRDHVRHPLSFPLPLLSFHISSHGNLPCPPASARNSSFIVRASNTSEISFSLAHHLLFVASLVAKLAIIARETNARSPPRTSR